jgi:hypothetical protein
VRVIIDIETGKSAVFSVEYGGEIEIDGTFRVIKRGPKDFLQKHNGVFVFGRGTADVRDET